MVMLEGESTLGIYFDDDNPTVEQLRMTFNVNMIGVFCIIRGA